MEINIILEYVTSKYIKQCLPDHPASLVAGVECGGCCCQPCRHCKC